MSVTPQKMQSMSKDSEVRALPIIRRSAKNRTAKELNPPSVANRLTNALAFSGKLSVHALGVARPIVRGRLITQRVGE
jgi:hypothetical protein